MGVFQKKQNKKEKVEEINKTELTNVETTETDDTAVDTDLVESVVLDSETPAKASKSRTPKKEKTVCRIIVATPSYFVINKDGETITVTKKNNYHRGEEILY